MIAKEHCGLKEKESLNKGTYTNFAQKMTRSFSITHVLYVFKVWVW